MDTIPETTETLVIGGGPGGYVAAIRASQLGQDVLLVEKDAVGGVCLNHGCIPSKALITATKRVHELGHMESLGVYADPYVDVGELTDWKDGVVDRLTGGVEQLLEANGVTVLDGRAEFVDEDAVEIRSDSIDGDPARIAFEQAIVATGSRPIEIPGFSAGSDRILTSKDALELRSIPDRAVVIGAGYIGLELSTVLAKLGSKVTVIELLDTALPGFDDDLTRVVEKRATELGIEFRFGESAERWTSMNDGTISVETTTDDGENEQYDADVVLLAVGREPVTETMEPERAGIELTDRGFIATDAYGETSADDIYAIGDVAGEPMLAHQASHEGIAVAETIAGDRTPVESSAVPAAVFTDPEIATVGYTPEEASEAGYAVRTGRFPFAASGRAMTSGNERGFVRVVLDEDDGTVLGGQIVGEHASELIGELALAVEAELDAETITSTIHTHPTLSEAIAEACEHALDRAIHTTSR